MPPMTKDERRAALEAERNRLRSILALGIEGMSVRRVRVIERQLAQIRVELAKQERHDGTEASKGKCSERTD